MKRKQISGIFCQLLYCPIKVFGFSNTSANVFLSTLHSLFLCLRNFISRSWFQIMQYHKKGWAPKNWCFQNVVLGKTLESPLVWKIKPVSPKGNQSWIFIGRTDADTEASILWPPEAKSQLIRKDSATGKDWRQEEKRIKRDEMFGRHHWLHSHESEQTPGDSEGQRRLGCCSPWGQQSRAWLSNWTTTTTNEKKLALKFK